MRNPFGPRADGEYRVFGRIDSKTTEATFNNEDSGIGMGEDQGLFLEIPGEFRYRGNQLRFSCSRRKLDGARDC